MSALLQEYISALSGGNYTHNNSHMDLLSNGYIDYILKPRPPVIGEEKELDCNLSEKSTKSQTTTGKQTSSSNAESNSACLTPRKSKLSFSQGAENSNEIKKIIAPLGFEPEGCSYEQDNFKEANQSNIRPASDLAMIPALKWALSLVNLLNDGEGVRLFRQFLAQEKFSNVLDFWFACQGLKLVPDEDSFMLMSLVRLIYRKYIRKEALGLRNDTKRKIVEQLRSNVIDTTIFEKAQEDIIENMKHGTYPQFLKSDLYLEYVQTCLDKSQKSIGNSSGSNESSGSDPTAKSFLNPLPTLHENDTFKSKIKDKSYYFGKSSNSNVLLNLNDKKEYWLTFKNHNSLKEKDGHNYPLSYAPVSSCFDSEIQSLSSDTHTDEYMSQNENIYQVERIHRHAPAKKMKRISCNNSNVNSLQDQNNLKYNKASNNRDLAEKNPAKFADILINKLKKIKEDELFLQKLKSAVLYSNSNRQNFFESTPIKSQLNTNPFHITQNQLKSEQQQQQQQLQPYSDTEDIAAAQSILEHHVSRIWNDEDTAMEQTFPPTDYLPQQMRKSFQNIPTQYNSAFHKNDDNLLLGNYTSMNSLNMDVNRHNEIKYSYPVINKHERTMPTSRYMFNDPDYEAWSAMCYATNNIKNSSPYMQLNMNSSTLPRNDAFLYHPETLQLKAGSMVELGRNKGQKRESSRSDTEAGWMHSQQHRTYNMPHQNRQPLTNLFDSYLGNHIAPANRFVSPPPTSASDDKTVIGYYFCDEAVPYRTTMPGVNITLGQFKQHISKKGNYRYFFKKASDEFGSGVVNEEIFNNNDILPLWEGKIFGKIERIIQ